MSTDLILAALVAFAALAAYVDLRKGRISNKLVLAGCLVALATNLAFRLQYAPTYSSALTSLLAHAALGVAACGLTPSLLWYCGALGGGDVKLLAVVGLFMGPVVGSELNLYAFVLAAFYALSKLVWRGVLLRSLKHSLLPFFNMMRPRERRAQLPADLALTLRFAPAVFAASCLVLLGHWVGT